MSRLQVNESTGTTTSSPPFPQARAACSSRGPSPMRWSPACKSSGRRFFLWMTRRPPSRISLAYGAGAYRVGSWALPARTARQPPKTSCATCSHAQGALRLRAATRTTSSACQTRCLLPMLIPATSWSRWACADSGRSSRCAHSCAPIGELSPRSARATSSCLAAARTSRARNPSSSRRFPKVALLF